MAHFDRSQLTLKMKSRTVNARLESGSEGNVVPIGQRMLYSTPELQDSIALYWNDTVLKKLRLVAPRNDHPLNRLATRQLFGSTRVPIKIRLAKKGNVPTIILENCRSIHLRLPDDIDEVIIKALLKI